MDECSAGGRENKEILQRRRVMNRPGCFCRVHCSALPFRKSSGLCTSLFAFGPHIPVFLYSYCIIYYISFAFG